MVVHLDVQASQLCSFCTRYRLGAFQQNDKSNVSSSLETYFKKHFFISIVQIIKHKTHVKSLQHCIFWARETKGQLA
jgi:hypothetical protein